MTRGSEPGTGISRAHSSGTRLSPISRAATAGNSASRSSVSVKMQLDEVVGVEPRCARSARASARSVASRMASASLARRCWRRGGRSGASGAAIQSAQRGRGRRAAAAARPRRGRAAGAAPGAQPRRAAAGRSATRSSSRDAVPDGLEHAPHLALAALVDRQLELVRARARRTRAGAVRPSSSSTPSRSARSARSRDRRAAHLRPVDLRGTSKRGCISRCASSPSLVSRISPVRVGVEAADRVQAPAPARASTTVARPCGSARWRRRRRAC